MKKIVFLAMLVIMGILFSTTSALVYVMDTADIDGDGLPDFYEEGLDGYDEANKYSDGGIHDDYNRLLQQGQTVDSGPDTDGDGLSDFWELTVSKSNPFSNDSDGDGLLDGDEYESLTSPVNSDTDGDGASDYDEIVAGTPPGTRGVDGPGSITVEQYNNGSSSSVLLEELPGLTNEDILREFEKTGQAGFTYYLQWIIRIAIALGSIIAVSTLIFGGFLYITTDNFLSKGKGRMMIINALWGFVLLLMSYVLLGQINSDLLQIKFAPKVVQVQVTNEPKLVYGISWQEYNSKYRDSAAYKEDDYISHYIGNKSKKMAKCFLKMSKETYTYESGPQKGQVIPLSERQCISVNWGSRGSFIGMVIPKQ